jgi:hypothetical protein
MTIPFQLLLLASIAGAAVPFALNNQQTETGVFSGYKVFTCPECLSFWVGLIGLMLAGGNPAFAGIAPIFSMFIRRYIL